MIVGMLKGIGDNVLVRFRKSGKRLAKAAVPIEAFERRCLLSTTVFTITPAQTTLTVAVSAKVVIFTENMTNQGQSTINSSESSLTTHFTGTVLANVGSGTLQFVPGGNITAEINGDWKPGNDPGATGNPTTEVNADFGGVISIPEEGTDYLAGRGIVFDLSSPVLNASGGTYAVDNAMQLIATQGNVYSDGISEASGDTNLTGDSEYDQSGKTATLQTNGSTETLTIPINVTYVQTDSSATITSTYTGTIVATATVIQSSPTYYLKLDKNGSDIDVYYNSTGTGTPAQQLVYSQQSNPSLVATSGAGSITIDNSAGLVIPPNGITVVGNGNTTLTVVGSGAGDTVTQNAGQIVYNTLPISFTGITTTTLNPNGGTDTLAVNADHLNLTAAPAGGGILKRSFSSITIGSRAELQVLTPAAHPDRALLVVGSLTIAGSTGNWTGLLDLGGNDMDLQSGSLLTVSNMAANLQDEGLTSSTASANTTHLTALGVIQNNQGGSPIFGTGTGQSSFDGTIPGASDILIKYTYFGDTNLDGKVDGSDYSRTDNGFVKKLTGWFNGDFNYDGSVDGSDYTLIDNAFNTQRASLAAMIASPAASPQIAQANTRNSPQLPSLYPDIFQSQTPVTFAGTGGGFEESMQKKDILDAL